MAHNFLKLNDDKTEMLVIGSRYHPPPHFTPLHIGDAEIVGSASARNIGVIFDVKMTQHQHVNAVTSQAFNQIRKLGKVRKYLTKPSTKTMVHAYVTSRLDYCNSLLFGLPWKNCIEKLQYAQNTAAKLVLKKRKRDHISDDLENDLHWLPVRYRIIFKILVMTFKALHNLAPGYISDLIHQHAPNRRLRSGDLMLLVVSNPNLKTYGARAFSYAAPVIWNDLPVYIRQCKTLVTFKAKLKTHLFKLAFP